MKQIEEAAGAFLEQAQRIRNVRGGHLLPALMDPATSRIRVPDRGQTEPPFVTRNQARERIGD
jgi:hypothetical protein